MDNKNIEQKTFNPRSLLKDIILGVSFIIDPLSLKKIYIKHNNNMDGAESEEIYNENYEKAISMGLINNSEQLEYLKSEGVWTDQDEYLIKDQERFIETMKLSKQKVYLDAQIKQINEAILEAQNKINELLLKKEQLMGFTAERFATKKQNEFFIYNSLYKDLELKEKFFSFEEYDYLEETALVKLIEKYNQKIFNFSTKNIQRLALEPLFLNSFSLCDNDPYKNYGKPICLLTYYQTELFSDGCNFKHILSELKDNLEPELLKDPEKLTDYYYSTKNIKEIYEKSNTGKERDGGALGIVGDKSDIRKLKGKNALIVDPVIAKLKKQGHVSFQEYIDMQPP